MNAIFHEFIGKFMEIYLRKAFIRMRKHGLKMNPLKCAFGVAVGNFLGFIVHKKGIMID